MVLYHGSPQVVERPALDKGKEYNDYGQGFYCTQHLELAREWACAEHTGGYVNRYELQMEGLRVLQLSSEEYSVLHWLALLMEHRRVRLSTPVMVQGTAWLKENFLLDISPFDVMIGYRADDSYFSFARAFVNNEISLQQLARAMRLGELGEQVVLKSQRAFDLLQFHSCEAVDSAVYHVRRKARDRKAREAYLEEAGKSGLEGIYIRDLIFGEVNVKDVCLR